MQFIGRVSERKRIARLLRGESEAVALVYGRRRVGKSELIKQSLRDTGIRYIYFSCKQTTELNNAQSLSVLASEVLGYPALAFNGIEDVLRVIFDAARESPLALVLDEYPYLRECCKGMDSVLQSLVDAHRDGPGVKLVLCGSFVEVMRSLLGEGNPLYGRVDLNVDLAPMDYLDSAQFYPGFTDEDKVRLYSVFGGIPHYNRLVDPNLSVRENVIELVTSPGARLENEVSMLLRAEVSKMVNANEVFEAMAQGYSRYKDILDQSHVSSGPAMVDALDKLVKMRVVEKDAPINAPENRKRLSYRICDPLSLFHYRYISRYASQAQVMDPEAFYDRFVEQDFEKRHVPHVFEDVCREYLIRRNRAGQIDPPFEKIGRYSYDDPKTRTNGEFDVVTEDELGYVFYEAKFRSTPVTQAIIDEEIRQVGATGLNCRRYGFFSRSGFDAEPSDSVSLTTLEEMYRQ